MSPNSSHLNKPNRLVNEKSPYLIQHAHNPVEWFPWGPEAFAKAVLENKPVFLSIGYSTCHWCHVMESESFEDEEVALVLNENFVSIKVDREERPDLDAMYMMICQMLNGSGGWPLTIIMTPDKKPFFAGTYFPKENKWGRIGLLDLLKRVITAWSEEQPTLLESAGEIISHLKKDFYAPSDFELNDKTLHKTFEDLKISFDNHHGGFGSAPKFPMPHNLLFLLRYWKRFDNPQALDMVQKTLTMMFHGGIYDQAGFGFHRYSTNTEWLVPHFEKMLYDQALLTLTFTEAFQAAGNAEFETAVRQTLHYVSTVMTHPEGGFYSAEDADSEGVEGKFYFWTVDEVKSIGGKDAGLFIDAYGILEKGNFMSELAQGNGHNKHKSNILHRVLSDREIADKYNITGAEASQKIVNVRSALFAERQKRVHPHKDDKILTDWNGLMIAAYSKAYQVFGDPDYLSAAVKAADFIINTLTDKRKLLHRYRDGEAGIQANLDDYMFFVWGLTELYEAGFDARYLIRAVELMNYALGHFWDEKNGAFFLTPDDGEELPVRTMEIYDGAIPSGNSIGLLNLVRLSRLTGEASFDDKASLLIRRFASSADKAPTAYTMFMAALDMAMGPSFEVLITGRAGSDDVNKMLNALRKEYIPNKVVLFKPDGIEPEITVVSPFTRYHEAIDGKATAYVCHNYACDQPATTAEEMMEKLRK